MVAVAYLVAPATAWPVQNTVNATPNPEPEPEPEPDNPSPSPIPSPKPNPNPGPNPNPTPNQVNACVAIGVARVLQFPR